MLGFWVDQTLGDRERAEFNYLRSGWSIAETLRQILNWRYRTRWIEAPRRRLERLLRVPPVAFEYTNVTKCLDFASGYGRVTRFLAPHLPPGSLWVSDILGEAVAFQREAFGVHGFASSTRPEDLFPERGFDAITVTSLFTHLPSQRFVAWLRALFARLSEDGTLIFSVHGEEILPPGIEMPRDGLAFREVSESASLDCAEYGSTWVTEEYVRRSVAEACRDLGWATAPALARLRRAVGNYQDLYVVFRGDGRAGSVRSDVFEHEFRYEPVLYIDYARFVALDTLEIRGWAVVRAGRLSEVEVVLDGKVLGKGVVEKPRDGVVELFGNEGLRNSGWECVCRLPPGTSRRRDALVFRAVDEHGTRFVLQAETIEGLLLEVLRLDLSHMQRRLEGLEPREARGGAT